MLMVISRVRSWSGRWGVAALIARLCLLPVSAQPSVSFDAALLTHYIDRGERIVDGPVFQSGLALAGGGWSFGVWGNIDLDDRNDRPLEVTETELSLAYGMMLDPLDIEIGLRQYLFPEATGTREAMVHAMLMIPLNPAVGVYYDFEEVEGVYVDLGGHHILDLTSRLDLELRAAVGYGDAAVNRDAFGYDQAAMRDLTLGGNLTYATDQRSNVSVGARWWRLVDADLRDAAGYNGGVVWTAAFHRQF